MTSPVTACKGGTTLLEPVVFFPCRYRNQYPILGLLSDDYQMTSPVKEAKTIVIERTGEMIKQVTLNSD